MNNKTIRKVLITIDKYAYEFIKVNQPVCLTKALSDYLKEEFPAYYSPVKMQHVRKRLIKAGIIYTHTNNHALLMLTDYKPDPIDKNLINIHKIIYDYVLINNGVCTSSTITSYLQTDYYYEVGQIQVAIALMRRNNILQYNPDTRIITANSYT